MKTTKAKQVKKSALGKPKSPSKGKPIPKAKPRSLGCGTHQTPGHEPKVI